MTIKNDVFVRYAGNGTQIGRKVGVGEIAIAVAQPGKVKAQYRDALAGECPGNSGGRGDVLAAGKAVGEQSITADITVRCLQCTAQAQSTAGKFYFLAHGTFPSTSLL